MANQKDINLRIMAKDAASKTISAINRRFGALSKAVAGVGAAIASYLSVRSITGFFRSAVTEAGGLEEALSRVSAVTRSTPEDMARLKDAAEEMGASTKFTASEAAGAMEELGRAGLNVDNTLQALPPVLSLAAGQTLELAQAADIVAGATAGMQMSYAESARVADVLALAASSAKTDVEGLGTALSYAAPNAVAAGLEIEELAAYIGTLANAGYDGSRSGTALSRMMAEFVNPASKMRKELAEVGITTDDFTEAMEQLEAQGDAALPVIVSLGQRAGPALRTLLGQGIEGVRGLTDNLRNAEGAAAAAADRMQNNLRGAVTALQSAWSALKITLVDPLLEPIADQVRVLTERIRTIAKDGSLDRLRDALVATFQRAVDAVTEFVASFGTVDQAIDRLTNGISSTLEWFSRLANAGKFAGNLIIAAFKAVDSAVSAVAAGLTTAVTGIAFGIDKVIQALNSLGVVSDLTALKSAAMVQTLHEMNIELGKRTVQSAKDAGNAVLRATENIAAMGDTVDAVNPKMEKLADSADDVAEAAEATEDGIFRSVEAFEVWAAEADKTAAAQENAKAATERTVESLSSLREKVTEAADELNRLIEAGASVDEITGASYRLETAYEALATATRAAREEQRQMAEQADESREFLEALGEEVDELDEDFEDLESTTAATAEVLETLGTYSATTAGHMDELKQRVSDAEGRLKLLISTGADMEKITEASRDLELAQRHLRDALQGSSQAMGAVGAEAEKTARSFDQLREQINPVNDLNDALARLAEVDRLARLRAELGQLHSEGQINSAKHAEAVAEIDARMIELRETTSELRRENEDLANSYQGVAEAAEEAVERIEAARGGRLTDPTSISNIAVLKRMLKLAEESVSGSRMSGGEQVKLAVEYRDAIRARIRELVQQREEAERETRLLAQSNAERERQQTNTSTTGSQTAPQPVRTVRIELSFAGRETGIDVLPGQEHDLERFLRSFEADAMRRQ